MPQIWLFFLLSHAHAYNTSMPQIARFLLSPDYSTSYECGVFALAPRRSCSSASAGKMPAMRIGLLALWHFMTAHFDTIFWRWNTYTHTHKHLHAGAHKSPATENHIISMHMCRTKSKTWRRPQATRHKHCVACFFLAFGAMWIIWHWTRYNALLLLACRQYVEYVTGYAYVCVYVITFL